MDFDIIKYFHKNSTRFLVGLLMISLVLFKKNKIIKEKIYSTMWFTESPKVSFEKYRVYLRYVDSFVTARRVYIIMGPYGRQSELLDIFNPLAPEFSFKFQHILYIKCE
jgi:hypothetical protein